ncbi:hypothetical protein GW765_00730 [Candidatus Parcubacteria bacterium]|nr:hypothetical protein [Candidatus Parcubacteria bacterium]
MPNIIKRTFLTVFVALQLVIVPISFMPQTAQAFTILPDCNGDLNGDGNFVTPCTFQHFLDLLKNVIEFIATFLMAPAIAIALAWAGMLVMTSGGNAAKRTEAKDIFVKVGLGIVFILGAWFIVEAVYSGLGYGGFLQFN